MQNATSMCIGETANISVVLKLHRQPEAGTAAKANKIVEDTFYAFGADPAQAWVLNMFDLFRYVRGFDPFSISYSSSA